MMFDLTAIGAALTQKGLVKKAFADMTKSEALEVCTAVIAAHTPEQEVIPYISYSYHEPVLVVPSNASSRFRRINLTGDDARKALAATLKMLGADYEMMRRYLGDDWQEELNV